MRLDIGCRAKVHALSLGGNHILLCFDHPETNKSLFTLSTCEKEIADITHVFESHIDKVREVTFVANEDGSFYLQIGNFRCWGKHYFALNVRAYQ